MFALGLGWSVSTVAASAYIAACSVADTRIQGATESTMSFISAGVAAGSGAIMAVWGFDGLIGLATLFIAALFVVTTRIRRATPTTGRLTGDEQPQKATR